MINFQSVVDPLLFRSGFALSLQKQYVPTVQIERTTPLHSKIAYYDQLDY